MIDQELKAALAEIIKESKRLAEHHGRYYALNGKQDERISSVYYSAQLRLAESLHWHFTGGAEEDGSEPTPWDADSMEMIRRR